MMPGPMTTGDTAGPGTPSKRPMLSRPLPGTRPVETLKTRPEFQRIRGGVRASMTPFLLEAKARPPLLSCGADTTMVLLPDAGPPRFGLTITKKIGGAVQRNKIRRRLKDAIRRLQEEHARPGFDYVIVARGASLDCPFAALMADLATALIRAHRPVKSSPVKSGPPNSGPLKSGPLKSGPQTSRPQKP
jgi:ribonuclease P protein component